MRAASAIRFRQIITALSCAVLFGSAALAYQSEQKKDADIPPEIAKLPFEIRDGYRKFAKRCTTCHDSKRVEEAKKSLFDWQGTVGKMAFKKGADIPLEDRQPIFLYLTYLHGTKGTPEEKEQYLTFLAKCEDCHGVALMYKEKKHPLKEWPAIVHRMAAMERAKISPEEEKKVMGYIERMHPDLFGVD
ncbi:MAG: hypothetical protein ACK47B_16880 [Armatimonadota bacterium]